MKISYTVAAAEFVKNYPEGHIVSHEEMYRIFGMPCPERIKELNFREGSRLSLKYMSSVESLRNALLRMKCDLQNIRAKGYRLVPHDERVQVATQDGYHELKRAQAKMSRRLRAIPRLEELNLEDKLRLEHAKLTLKYVSTVLNGQMKAQRERDDERRNG